MIIDAPPDLTGLIVSDLGSPARKSGRPWWLCPFHDDRNKPNLTITPDRRHWKCFGCGEHGDAITWIRKRTGCSFAEACERLSIDRPGNGSLRPTPAPVQHAKPSPPSGWSNAALEVVKRCERLLWEPQASRALAWLRSRGLNDETIRRARLGYSASARSISGLYVVRGIVIPWFDGERVTMLQVRRAEGDPKYQAVKGSRRGGLYPSPPRPGRPVLICEGEFDAMLACKEAGELVEAVTLGGAADKPVSDALTALACASVILVGTDLDAAGESAARAWSELTARAHRIRPPDGEDLTDAHVAGVRLDDWIAGELANVTTETTAEPWPPHCVSCRSTFLWMDGGHQEHCQRCNPPSSNDVVICRFDLGADATADMIMTTSALFGVAKTKALIAHAPT